jgi:phosphate transport system permease protein
MQFNPYSFQSPPTDGWKRNLRRQSRAESIVQATLAAIACIPISIAVAIVAILIYETVLFFQDVSLWNFLTDTEWTPRFASQQFGILVLASATFLVTGIALIVAIPIGLLAAIYLAEYAPPKVRWIMKPILEALSGIPTVVYGYFAFLVVTPLLQELIPGIAIFNGLSAGLVTGVTIIPIVSSLSEDAIRGVPDRLREASYALGLTKRETIINVLLPVAFPGIVASFTLAASRALGETMIAAIAAGQNPQLTLNPLVPIETMTAFIIQVSLGTVAFNSLAFRTIFTVGMVLFLITLTLNTFGYWLVRHYQQSMTQVVVPSTPRSDNSNLCLDCNLPPPQTRELPISMHQSPGFQIPFTRRHRLDRFFSTLTFLATLVALAFLGLLLLDAFRRGMPQLDWQFLTSIPSRNPEKAGIYPALMGSLWLLAVTLVLSLPISIATAIYLEEYCPDNWLNKLLEINIANLSAVPSIIYGLLGLELFVRLLAPLTGGPTILSAALTLTVVILPLSIVTTRSALRRVSASLHQAGYAIGMTRTQVLWHIVLPTALPGTLTGALLSLARAVGETAPLIAVGALSFISFAPPLSSEGLRSRFTALPFQIFNWVSRPQQAFHNNAAAAIIVLIAILFVMNVLALLLRNRTSKS